MKDFFISYNKEDRGWAEWIAWQLDAEGYSTFLQAWDFNAGSNFVLEMQKGATEYERTIAVLSPDYLKATFTQPEWAAAVADDPTGEQRKLIMVRVRECDPTGLLKAIVYIDLVGLDDEEKARETLLKKIKQERAKPDTPPPFPGAKAKAKPDFPGSLPGIWNVPLNRNPHFTGREDILRQLRDALTSGHRAALTQTIHGLGGVGKTQLALEYAYRHKNDYSCVWWVRSETPEQLAADYARLAHALDLPEKDAKEQALTIAAVRRWLQENEDWLLIFDNAPGPEEIRDYLPGDSRCHVIITSRNPNWRAVAGQPMEIPVMPPDEAVEFLLDRTGLSDGDAVRKLAGVLDCLPLALEQAAAYIEETGKPLEGYLALFKENRKKLLRQQPGTEYEETVATTWSINLTELGEESPAGGLLNLCAFMAPDDIPMEIIRDGAEHLPPPLDSAVTDETKFDEAVAALRRYSLVNIGSDALSVHRMVQAVVQDRLVEKYKKKWASAAVEIVNRAFPFEASDVQTWPACSRLLPHALASADHAETLGAAPRVTGYLLNQAGLYLQERADFARAKACFERALEIDEKTLRKDHPKVAIRVNNLGRVLHDMGDLDGAKTHFERALEIGAKTLGKDHPIEL